MQTAPVADPDTTWPVAALHSPPADTPTTQTGLTYTSLTQQPTWQQATLVPTDVMPLPAQTSACAKLIRNYLTDQRHSGNLEPTKPVLIIQLEAGPGCFSSLLQRALTQHNAPPPAYRYLITNRSQPRKARIPETIQHIETHPQEIAQALAGNQNPVIVIAQHTRVKLGQELVYLHYGDLYQSTVAIGPDQPTPVTELPASYRWQATDTPEAQRLYYRWQKQANLTDWLTGQPEILHPSLTAIMTDYLHRLEAQPLHLPIQLLNLLAIIRAHSTAMLSIISDYGATNLNRLSRTRPPHTPDEIRAAPLNLHSIACWGREEGGWTHVTANRSGSLQQVIIQWPEPSDQNKARRQNTIAATKSAEQQRYRQQTQTKTTENEKISALHLSQADPHRLADYLPELLKEGVHYRNRQAWWDIAECAWHHYIPSGLPGIVRRFPFQLGLFAIDINHWALARDCLHTCEKTYGGSVAIWHNQALIAHSTGDMAQAQNLITHAEQAEPEDMQIQQLAAEICEYADYCQQQTWYKPAHARQGDHTLQPLAPQHAAEFYRNYQHPHLPSLLRSHPVTSIRETEHLIRDWQAEGCKQSHAIMHHNLGYLGCVALEPYSNSPHLAHFSIWIGEDHQNQGHGQQAAHLCLRQAAANSTLDYLITSIWAHNHRSRHLIHKLGFQPIGYETGNGKTRETYYACPLPQQPLTNEQKQHLSAVIARHHMAQHTT
ncbi:MAG: GNAT family N-acetyltransferase [Pseudomonadota bacterium]